MIPKDLDIHIFDRPETELERITCAQLRLSNQWRVTGKTILNGSGEEVSDDHPDIPEPVGSGHLSGGSGYRGEIAIRISRVHRKTYLCPICGSKCKPIGYEFRKYRHVDDLAFKCYLWVDIPKLRCECCGGTPQIRFPIAWERASYTREFAKHMVSRLKVGSKTSVARELDTTYDIVDGVMRRITRLALAEQDLSHVTGVYLDETQFGSGQDYISVFLDQNHKVIYICHGHGTDVLDLFLGHLVLQGGDPGAVRFFSTDMSAAYESGILSRFPNATLVWDRFHLAKAVNEALNDVRKKVVSRGKDESLRSVKYVVLRRRSNMDRNRIEKLRVLSMYHPELALAFDMKETFLEIIRVPDRGSMVRSLRAWIDWVIDCGPPEMVRRAKRFLEKMEHIVAWTMHPVSNSVSEGVNKNIQDIRRQGYGYRNLKAFFDMILLRQGDLTYRF